MEELKKTFGQDYDKLSRMSIVEEGAVKVKKTTFLSQFCLNLLKNKK